jgi:hypothetical protein
LCRWGGGFYLGRGGEVSVYYDHRRDDFAAGASPGGGPMSGFVGHVGASWLQPLSDRFGLGTKLEFGSAWVASTVLEARFGRPR